VERVETPDKATMKESNTFGHRRPIAIVGIGGSLREGSASLAALDIALTAAAQTGAEVKRFAVGELDLPFYREDLPPPTAALELSAAAAAADGLIWSAPMYHGTVSGALKNALDWLQLLADHDPPFLTDKPIGLVSTASGVQGLQAINSMEYAVRALRGWAMPLVVPVSHALSAFDHDGRPRVPELQRQLEAMARGVVAAADRLRDPSSFSTAPGFGRLAASS
jgi:FMN reductase